MEGAQRKRSIAFQQGVFRLLSPPLHQYGYALAGSGAIREYKLIDRPTDDIDLFTVRAYERQTKQATNLAITLLEDHGYAVRMLRHSQDFTRLVVSKQGASTQIDLAVDARRRPAVHLPNGWVLAKEDAIPSKIVAMTFRGEPRDYLDGLAIYRQKPLPMRSIYRLCHHFDATFSEGFLLRSLHRFRQLDDRLFLTYVNRTRLDSDRRLARQWASQLSSEVKELPDYVPPPPHVSPQRFHKHHES